jgi:hypothetical protein|tara:strand:+ start:3617 stop:3811 length:195 start_codon:yes stop_codon:yes gene_type:complete
MAASESEVVQEVMKQFEDLWPKILWVDPNLETYKELIRSVYAHGMTTSLKVLKEHLNKLTATIH